VNMSLANLTYLSYYCEEGCLFSYTPVASFFGCWTGYAWMNNSPFVY
jgi:hypothetical protein